jgi:hypothetical protein
MKPPNTNIELVPPESILKLKSIWRFSSYPMVPTITIKSAYNGPALPIIDENAIRLESAQRKPAVRDAW